MDSANLSPEILQDLQEKFEEVSSIVHFHTSLSPTVQEVKLNSYALFVISQLVVVLGLFCAQF